MKNFTLDPAEIIVEQLTGPNKATQSEVALTYAKIIAENGLNYNFHRLNLLILKRWPKGLNRVKTEAWKLYDQWVANAKLREGESGDPPIADDAEHPQ